MKNKTQEEILLEVGVKALIFNDEGLCLLLKRAKPYVGQKICKWDIPGGRIIPGEKTEKALKREIKEETGLVLEKINKILAVQDILRVKGKHTVRVTYQAQCKLGKIKLDSGEHSVYQWVSVSDLKNFRLDKYLTPVINNLLQNSTPLTK